MDELTLSDDQGSRVAGEYYRSVFDMAVIVHPEEAGRYGEGTELHVKWTAVDRLGRSADGEGAYRIVRHEHGSERKEAD